jgi:hypothetical protein
MEGSFETSVMARIVADEMLRDSRREPVKLEPGLSLAHLIQDLLRLFE